MSKNNLLLEDFTKFVPEFMLHQACESCVKRWEKDHKIYKHRDNSNKFVEDLRQLFIRFLFNDPMFTDKAKKNEAMANAQRILNLVYDDIVKVLTQVGKERADIHNDIKVVIQLRVSEYMRLV